MHATHARHQPLRRATERVALATLLPLTLLLAPAGAQAGTYPMYQCGAGGTAAVAPGWSVDSSGSGSNATLSNACATGGTLGLDVFTGTQGILSEGNPLGGGVSLDLNTAGGPDITIASVHATEIVSQNTGDDAFLGQTSGATTLPGGVELPYGTTAPYTQTNTWTLPQGATNFDVSVFCSTDKSQTACAFPDAAQVPALDDITLTLNDSVAPTLSAISGTLANAAQGSATVTGTQTLSFTAADADSGVRTATATLTPQAGGTPTSQTTSYSCNYSSWNACPLSESGSSLSVNTATLKDGTYAVALSDTDAAGNTYSDPLGRITTTNAPTISSSPTISGTATVGDTLTATVPTPANNASAGTVTLTGQWQRCDTAGNNCNPIAGATGASYNLGAADQGDMLRYQEIAANGDGSTSKTSDAFGPIATATSSKGGSGGNGGNGSGTKVTITVTPAGPERTTVALGTRAAWRVSLAVSPRAVRRHTQIKLTGSVATSPRPTSGKLIDLQARTVSTVLRGRGRSRHRLTVYGAWVTFNALRAEANGTYKATYRFRLGGHHRYQFRAIAPKEGGFRNATGTSAVKAVTET